MLEWQTDENVKLSSFPTSFHMQKWVQGPNLNHRAGSGVSRVAIVASHVQVAIKHNHQTFSQFFAFTHHSDSLAISSRSLNN